MQGKDALQLNKKSCTSLSHAQRSPNTQNANGINLEVAKATIY